MKRLFLFILLGLMWCNIGYAERVTLGFVGDSCLKFNENKKKFGKEFDEIVQDEMTGFFTGYNMYVAIHDGGTEKMKTLDHNSMEYAYKNIVEFCRTEPNNHVFFGLIDYYKSLPN